MSPYKPPPPGQKKGARKSGKILWGNGGIAKINIGDCEDDVSTLAGTTQCSKGTYYLGSVGEQAVNDEEVISLYTSFAYINNHSLRENEPD